MNSFDSTIEKAIRNHEREVALLTRITDYDLYMSVRNVMRNNPDIFWFSHQWEYKKEEHKVFFRYTIDQERCEKIARQIDDVVKNDFKLDYVRTLSCREQMMYVYKWIALYCNYTILSAHNQTIYSVFVLRHSVCTGIAKAAQYLLKLLGIESRLVFGKMNNSEKDSRHCWLVVNIEGRWYHLDPTFALPETEHLLRQCGVEPLRGDDFLFYNFFSVDTATIKQSRTIEEEELLPVCIENVEHTILQNINVTPSRNGEQAGLGCLLSDVGTTAEIYLAHDKDKHNRHRAVAKVFKDDPDHELLRKELIVMRECAGPHLLRATDADFNKGILYIVQATPLSELLSSHYYKLTLKGLCNLLIDIASGLKDLLCHGIIYRDIHINNIYLWTDSLFGTSAYKLGDFGSCAFTDRSGKYAGLTERGGVGSKWYMAPETFSGMGFDERSAVYGVGMIAYYLLNDLYPPFWQEYGEDSLGIRMQSSRVPKPSKLQEKDFCQLRMDFIFVSLNHHPSERYQTLSELIDAIKECRGKNPDKIVVEGNRTLTELRTEIKTEESRSCEEEYFWKEALSSHKIESLMIYLERFPQGLHQREARNLILKLERQQLEEEYFWKEALSSRKIESLMIYLERFPQGLHQREARNLILKLEQQQLEEEYFWKEALSSHKIESLMMYLDRFPQGSHCFEARSLIYNFHQAPKQRIDDFATTCALESHDSPPSFEKNLQQKKTSETYFPCRKNNLSRISTDDKESTSPTRLSSNGLFGRLKKLLFGKTSTAPVYEETSVVDIVNSSIFAPSETKRGDYMLVQVFLYRDDEERAVTCKAAEVDPDAHRQNYTPLSVKLKEGDKVKAKLTMSGKGIEVDESIQEMIWQGHYTDCQFGVFVPEDYRPSSMIGTVMLTVNEIPCGRMMFKTKIVSQPQKLYAKIESKVFQKIFISYSHKDESTVKYFAKAFQAQGVDYFFDRHYLKAGDVYPLKIKEYINSADLFILCWSKNAAESDYVTLERRQALELAYPQVDMDKATITIHPISIEPHADYPSDMKEVYNFEEI